MLGLAFFAIATGHWIYAPGAHELQQRLAADSDDHPYMGTLAFGHLVFVFVRKVYSVIAFAIVGLAIAPLVPRERRLVVCSAAVGAFSAAIEITQALERLPEPFGEHCFDVACGVLGGFLGASLWNAARAIVRRSR